MKRILCFGDSNTWGKDSENDGRFPKNVRWTGILAEHLGKDFEIIEEGLIGRTTVLDDPIDGEHKNGRKYLVPCLASHAPLDLVIIMLGTSDLKKRFSLTALDITKGIEILIEEIQRSFSGPYLETSPEILILSPPPLGEGASIERYQDAKEKEELLSGYYQALAEKKGCAFLETKKYIHEMGRDHLHLTPAGHKKLAIAVAAMVTKILNS
jgi:lysophospholipase L1-like esterase